MEQSKKCKGLGSLSNDIDFDVDPFFIEFAALVSKDQCLSDQGLLVRQKLIQSPIQQLQFDILLKKFSSKPTPTPQCTTIFNTPQLYYKCHDCMKHQDACICHDCFINGNHHHHRFQVRKCGYNTNGTCDCGNGDVWRADGFCKNHKGQEGESFIKCFKDLFRIYFKMLDKLHKKQERLIYQSQLFKYLLKINTQSLYYNQLTHTLLSSNLRQLEQTYIESKTIMEQLMTSYVEFFMNDIYQLIVKMIPLKKFKYFLIKCFIQSYNRLPNFKYSQYCKNLFIQVMGYKQILDQLAKEHQIILYPQQNLDQKYINDLKFIQNLEDVPYEFWKCFIKKGVIKKHYVKIKLMLPNIIAYFRGMADMQEYIGIVIRDIIDNQHPQNIIDKIYEDKNFCSAVMVYYNCQIQKINITELIQTLKISKDTIKKFISTSLIQLVESAIKNISLNTVTVQIILRMIKEMDQQFNKSLMSQFWQFFDSKCIDKYIDEDIGSDDQMFCLSDDQYDQQYKDKAIANLRNILKLLYTVTQVMRSIIDESCYLILTTTLKINFTQQMELQLIKKKQHYLQCIFSEKQTITQYDLRSIIKNKIGQYQGMGSFIKKIAKYNSKKHQYTYIGEIIKDSRIKMCLDIGERVTYNQKIQLTQLQKQFRDYLFTHDFLKHFVKIFDYLGLVNYSVTTPGTKRKILQMLLYSLVLMHILFQNQNQVLLEIIKYIQINAINDIQGIQQDFHSFYSKIRVDQSSLANLRKLLVVQKQQKYNSEQISFIPQKKIKMQQIKKKKFQQIKAKMKKVKISQTQEDINQKQCTNDCCLFCHQGITAQHPLYCFSLIVSNFSISNLLLSNKEQINIKTCQHYVHKDCFMKKNGHLRYFLCPLCRNIYNCILPKNYSKLNIQDNQEWQSRIETVISLQKIKKINLIKENKIQVQSYNFLKNMSIFKLLFHYLIFSKSIKCFFTNGIQESQRLRTDQIVHNILVNMFTSDDESKKKVYRQQLKQIQNQITIDQSINNNIKLSLKMFVYKMLLNEFYGLENLQNQLCEKEQKEQTFSSLISIIDGKVNYTDFLKIVKNFPHHSSNPQTQQLFSKYFQSSIEIHPLHKNLRTVSLPQNAQQFLKFRVLKCSKCNEHKIKLYQCLICQNKRYCQSCQSMRSHSIRKHFGDCIFIDLVEPELIYFMLGFAILKQKIYFNEFNVNWKLSQHPKGYSLSHDKSINKTISCIFNNDIPEVIEDKTKLIVILNSMKVINDSI